MEKEKPKNFMEYKNLHTYVLEKEYGSIKGHIIKQNDTIRMIHLQDNKGISKTLGVVRFLNTNNDVVKTAHKRILKGELLGKTLIDLGIAFDKKFIGSFQMKLPNWLKIDFNTSEDNSIAFFSKIYIQNSNAATNHFLYSELIEILPPNVIDLFEDKIKPLPKKEEDLLSLLDAANLTEIKEQKKYG